MYSGTTVSVKPCCEENLVLPFHPWSGMFSQVCDLLIRALSPIPKVLELFIQCVNFCCWNIACLLEASESASHVIQMFSQMLAFLRVHLEQSTIGYRRVQCICLLEDSEMMCLIVSNSDEIGRAHV